MPSEASLKATVRMRTPLRARLWLLAARLLACLRLRRLAYRAGRKFSGGIQASVNGGPWQTLDERRNSRS